MVLSYNGRFNLSFILALRRRRRRLFNVVNITTAVMLY